MTVRVLSSPALLAVGVRAERLHRRAAVLAATAERLRAELTADRAADDVPGLPRALRQGQAARVVALARAVRALRAEAGTLPAEYQAAVHWALAADRRTRVAGAPPS